MYLAGDKNLRKFPKITAPYCTSPPLCSAPCAVLYLATCVPCAALYLLLLHQDTLGGEGEECATIVLCRVLCCLPFQPLPRVRVPHTVVYSNVLRAEIQSMLGFC